MPTTWFCRLEPFHYQCSRSSTSTEIESVFKRAIERQSRQDRSQLQCMVFMDEAGLPEDGKESLKVKASPSYLFMVASHF